MSLSYEFDHKLALLAPVLDEQAEWFSYVMRRILYPELQIIAAISPSVTESQFPPVGRAGRGKGRCRRRAPAEAVARIFDEPATAGRKADGGCRPGQKPDVAAFDELIDRYDDFQQQIRRLEYDAVAGR